MRPIHETSCLRRHGSGYLRVVQLGTSIFLIALGAILRYAVTATVSGIDLTTVGLILMIVGVAGLLISMAYLMAWRPRRGRLVREQVVEDPYREPPRSY